MEIFLSIVFWLVALSASVLYGRYAVAIHSPPKRPNQTADDEAIYPSAWHWHQRWLNFVGSLVGWLALWFLLRTFGSCVLGPCAEPFAGSDALLALIAFVGVTGYIPGLIVAAVSATSALSARLAELLASLISKLK